MADRNTTRKAWGFISKMTIDLGNHIEFVLVTRTKGIFFTPNRHDGLEFIPSSAPELRFVLKPLEPEADACGSQKGLECKLYASYPVTKDQYDFIVSYTSNSCMLRISDEFSLPFKYQEKILIDEKGKYKKGFSPRRYLCPSDIQQLIEYVESKLASQTNYFLKLLRWRQGYEAPAEVADSSNLYWRIDEGCYLLAPLKSGPHNKFTTHTMHGICWDEEHKDNLQDLWAKDGIAEPLGRTLVREAIALADESPRSAILIMTTALETGVKIHISSISPNTDWLMEEIPSPPIFKILRDYIPLIHKRLGNDLLYWEKVKPFIKDVQKLVELRNKVAHTGNIPKDSDSIYNYLELVSDLLYLLDVLQGHDWAKSLTSYKFRQALDWPEPKHTQTTITISQPY